MASQDYASALNSILSQQNTHPLSILTLATPLLQQLTSTSHDVESQICQSDASTTSSTDNPTALSLSADLAHYKDLFSKLRFSYLEQVTKEKYLRSIVGEPPLLVSHADNAQLEDELAIVKAQLKAKKEEVDRLVSECKALAQDLAKRWEGVQLQTSQLEVLPVEVADMEARVQDLQAELQLKMGSVPHSSDPRMNLGLDETKALVQEQQAKARDIEKQIAALQRQLPSKMRECEAAERDLEMMERRRDEATTRAREARRVKEEGGRDVLEEQARWYKSAETILRGLVGIEGQS